MGKTPNKPHPENLSRPGIERGPAAWQARMLPPGPQWWTLLFGFSRGVKAARNICAVYGDTAIGESMGRTWFSHFKEDRFHISDTARTGRSSGFDEDRLNTLIHNDPRQCTRELANVMKCDHFTSMRHLHSMGKLQKLNVWIPHALSQNHKQQSVSLCASLFGHHRLTREQHRLFLSSIVNGDEKWCLYANVRKTKTQLPLCIH